MQSLSGDLNADHDDDEARNLDFFSLHPYSIWTLVTQSSLQCILKLFTFTNRMYTNFINGSQKYFIDWREALEG